MLPHIPIINGLSDFVNRFGKFLSMTICLATEIWAGTQTSVAQAPCFGGLLGSAARTASRSERFEANRRRRLLGRDRGIRRDDPAGCLAGEGPKAASVWPQTKRIGAGRLPRVFSGLGPEARHPPRRPCGLPHGRGVSDPSPCAPPRQAGKLGPIGHCVVGFCGTARVEWAGPVWTKNRSRRAVTCVSLPPSQRRAPFRGIHKGASPLCVLFTLLFAQAKNKPSARTGPGILCRLRHTSQKR